jgi:hypothetical protein
MHNEVPRSLRDFSRPWNKNTSKTQTEEDEEPPQNYAKHV